MTTENQQKLSAAISKNQLDVAKKMIDQGVRLDDPFYARSLYQAVNKNNFKKTQSLIRAGAPIIYVENSLRYTLLHVAAANNNPLMVELFVKLGVPLDAKNCDGHTPIRLASQKKHWDCVRAIAKIKKIEGPDMYQYTHALYDAVSSNRVEEVNCLLVAGTPTNAQIKSTHDTMLHLAVREGNPHMIALLLARKMNPQIKNKEKKTPYELARSLELEIAYDEGRKLAGKIISDRIYFAIILVQFYEQNKNKINFDLLNQIIRFIDTEPMNIAVIYDRMTSARVRCVVKNYLSFSFFHKKSDESYSLIIKLKEILKNNASTNQSKDPRQEIKTFIESVNGDNFLKKRRSLELLTKFHLVGNDGSKYHMM